MPVGDAWFATRLAVAVDRARRLQDRVDRSLADHRPFVLRAGVIVGATAGIAFLYFIFWWVLNGFFAGDELTYWLAGHRLNVGHELYAVRPDDPWVFDIRPLGTTTPPFIAVPWRFLASTPGITGMFVWWVGMAFAVCWVVATLLLGTRGWAGLAVLPLVPSLTLQVGVANVNALVLAGIVASWLLMRSGHDRGAGVILGIITSIKLTPAVLLIWLAVTRRWEAVAAAAVTVAVLAIPTMAVTTPDIFLRYAGVMTAGASGGRTWALALVAIGLVLVWVLRDHPRASFAVAVAIMPLGAPVTGIHTWALLLACLTPLLPAPSETRSLRKWWTAVDVNATAAA